MNEAIEMIRAIVTQLQRVDDPITIVLLIAVFALLYFGAAVVRELTR